MADEPEPQATYAAAMPTPLAFLVIALAFAALVGPLGWMARTPSG